MCACVCSFVLLLAFVSQKRWQGAAADYVTHCMRTAGIITTAKIATTPSSISRQLFVISGHLLMSNIALSRSLLLCSLHLGPLSTLFRYFLYTHVTLHAAAAGVAISFAAAEAGAATFRFRQHVLTAKAEESRQRQR